MTDPTPLDDGMIDRLLGKIDAPEIAADFADRVMAEATRADRLATVPPLPPRVRAARRPWARRGMWAGVIAINLIVASAIAATLTGVAPRFAHVVAVAAHILHIHRHEAPAPHIAPPIRRLTKATVPAEALARPVPFARALPPARTPMIQPRMQRARQRPEFRADRPLHPHLRAGAARRTEHRWRGGGQSDHLNVGRRADRGGPAMRAQDQFGPRGFGRDPGAGEMRRPWAERWNGPQRQEMSPWRQRRQAGWGRPGRGGGRGLGWRRPFGRGRRF